MGATLPPPPMTGQMYHPPGQASGAGHHLPPPPAMGQGECSAVYMYNVFSLLLCAHVYVRDSV